VADVEGDEGGDADRVRLGQQSQADRRPPDAPVRVREARDDAPEHGAGATLAVAVDVPVDLGAVAQDGDRHARAHDGEHDASGDGERHLHVSAGEDGAKADDEGHDQGELEDAVSEHDERAGTRSVAGRLGDHDGQHRPRHQGARVGDEQGREEDDSDVLHGDRELGCCP